MDLMMHWDISENACAELRRLVSTRVQKENQIRLWRLSHRTGMSEDQLIDQAVRTFLDNHEISTSSDDEGVELSVELKALRSGFNTGHRLNGIRAFLLCLDKGRHPPEWVMTHLEKAFRAHMRNVTNSLDRLLGKAPPGQGHKESAIEMERRGERDMWVFLSVCAGRRRGTNLDVVCGRVEKRLEGECAARGWVPLKAGTIRSLWKNGRWSGLCKWLMDKSSGAPSEWLDEISYGNELTEKDKEYLQEQLKGLEAEWELPGAQELLRQIENEKLS